MAKPQLKKSETTLVLTRQFDAPREQVFRAWTDPKALMQWFAPADSFTTPAADVELRVGGRYRIDMVSADGKHHIVAGEYREVRAPERLVFTWAWASKEPETGDTLVTVELRDLGGRTELVLTHERFLTAHARDLHEQGHSGCLDRLQRLLAVERARRLLTGAASDSTTMPREREAAIVLRRQFDAPRAQVFRAWTDPQVLMQWFAPSADFQIPAVEVDLRVGGGYRIEMIDPDGKRHCAIGRYEEIRPPEKLVFTWTWERDEIGTGDTLVTVDLRDVGGRTELVLTHERFQTAHARELHVFGHTGCLARLQLLLAAT
ncbi:MAG: SRPBCC domain-containing protein [Gammaproteobacteria bacterium]|nr:SRPBCC domain-containing protein [Gammaproteobacteria bacterium]